MQGHIVDFSKGGKSEIGNLRAECTNCNEGLQNTLLPKPSRIELFKQIRRDGRGAPWPWRRQRSVKAALRCCARAGSMISFAPYPAVSSRYDVVISQ